MKSPRVVWVIVFIGAASFAASGVLASRSPVVSVRMSLDETQDRVSLAIHGSLAVLTEAMSYPKSGPGIALDWTEAQLLGAGMEGLAPIVRSIDRSRITFSTSGIVDPRREITLVYFLRSGSVEPGVQDMNRASGLMRDRFGVVDLDMYLPWPIDEAVRLDIILDESAAPVRTKLVTRMDRRFLVWHHEDVSIEGGPFEGALLEGGPLGVGSTILDTATKAVEFLDAKDLPYLIIDPTGPGAYCLVSDGVLVVQTTSAGPRARLSLGSALWRAAWKSFSGGEPTTLAHNLLLHGPDYLGMAAVAGPDQLRAVQDRAIERYFHALAAARVRPIPARPIGKENWHLLIPGLLAMLHAGIEDSAWGQGGFLAAMSALPEQPSEYGDDGIAELLVRYSPNLASIVSLGLIPGLEVPAPEGVTLDWFNAPFDVKLEENARTAPTLNVLAGAHVDQYLETCGCKTGQAGGLARRASVLEEAGAMCTLRVDCGGFLSGIPLRGLVGQASAEADAFLEAFACLPLDAVAIGYKEVCAGLDRVLDLRSPLRRLPLVCANLDPPPDGLPLEPYALVDLDGRRVAVLGWLGTDVPIEQMLTFEVGLAGWTVEEDLHSIQTSVAAARGQAEAVVLIGDLEHRFLRAHQVALNGIDIVLTSDGSDPSAEAFSKSYLDQRGRPEPYLIGQTVILTVPYGTASMARFTEVCRGASPLLVEQLVLDEAIPSSPSIEAVISKLSARFDADVSVIAERSDARLGYVGADRCRECHVSEYQDWIGTRHSGAMTTLQQVRRDRHAQCVACHVTGFGVDRGFSSSALRSKLLGVQCEVCHGPGEAHVDSQDRADIVRAPSPVACLVCHDTEHSDQFAGRFEEAYGSVSHRGARR